jgi:hypothetical protein
MCSAPHQLVFQQNSVLAGSSGCIMMFFYFNPFLKQVQVKKISQEKNFRDYK